MRSERSAQPLRWRCLLLARARSRLLVRGFLFVFLPDAVKLMRTLTSSVGGLGSTVPQNAPCLGSLGKNENGVCGVVGSYCGTLNQHYLQSPNDAYDQNCQSSELFDGVRLSLRRILTRDFAGTDYCNTGTFKCATRAALGESCAFDPIRGCQAGLFPNIDAAAETCVCLSTPQPGPSSRARARARERRTLTSLCPTSHTACSVGSAGGYECIDTSVSLRRPPGFFLSLTSRLHSQSNLEQCGACATDGGVDCTALDGVSAVGCVEGQCEVWRCEDGWTFDAVASACVIL